MNEEELKLINQEIEHNLKAGECGLASNSEKFQWTKIADALKHLLEEYINSKKQKEELINYCKEKREEAKEKSEMIIKMFGGKENIDYYGWDLKINIYQDILQKLEKGE